ncbi:MAG TPA: DUF6672 family protein [Holophaga sp.]|nr:DUF6672 family protein [Holophaga sp.]
MNGTATMDSNVKSRRMMVRGGLVVVYAILIAFVFYFGKGHTLLLDNKDSEDGSLKAFEGVTVTVDDQDPIEFMSGDRDQAKLRAQSHTVKVVVTNGPTVVKKISLPVTENMLVLSIPKLVAGIEPAVTVFVPIEEAAPTTSDDSSSNAAPDPAAAAPAAPAAQGTAPATPPAP